MKRILSRSSLVSTSLLRHSLQNGNQTPLILQNRGMFIQTQTTPNPNSLKFIPGIQILDHIGTYDFNSLENSRISPLARQLFRIEGVTRVFLAPDFISVTKDDNEQPWNTMKPDIFACIMDFFSSNQPVLLDEATLASTSSINDDDDEPLKEGVDGTNAGHRDTYCGSFWGSFA